MNEGKIGWGSIISHIFVHLRPSAKYTKICTTRLIIHLQKLISLCRIDIENTVMGVGRLGSLLNYQGMLKMIMKYPVGIKCFPVCHQETKIVLMVTW